MKRIANHITNKNDIEYLTNLSESDVEELSFIMETFGEFGDKRRFNPYDIITIPPNCYGKEGNKNKTSFTTTVGIWIFNKCFIEPYLFNLFHYINKPITKKEFKKINKEMSYALLEDKITLDDMKGYIMMSQKFQPYSSVLASSLTSEMMTISDKIAAKKKQLLKKYDKEIKNNDPVIVQKIEDELLNECKEQLKDDESMDMVNSGAKMSWGNNFKNMFVMRGAVKEADPTKDGFRIITSNFMDGISPDEYSNFANSLTGGPYARAKKTEVGGAWEKMYVRAFQHLRVIPNTDCGTKRTLTVTLTPDNIDSWMYSNIVEGNKLVEITSDTKNKYIGKTVKIRYSSLCESKDGICEACAGHLFTRIGLTEIGIASYNICSRVKVLSMKSFHDSTVKITDMEQFGWDKIFGK